VVATTNIDDINSLRNLAGGPSTAARTLARRKWGKREDLVMYLLTPSGKKRPLDDDGGGGGREEGNG
jgi:hypothetical protein